MIVQVCYQIKPERRLSVPGFEVHVLFCKPFQAVSVLVTSESYYLLGVYTFDLFDHPTHITKHILLVRFIYFTLVVYANRIIFRKSNHVQSIPHVYELFYPFLQQISQNLYCAWIVYISRSFLGVCPGNLAHN